jgi:hypothetical protein
MHQPMLLLFAQKAKGPPPEAAAAFLTVWAAVMCVGVVLGIIALVFAILHVVSEYKTLGMIRKRNRTMEPGMVFLVFVPVLSLFWIFFVVLKIGESLRNEFDDRGWRTEGESFGVGMGITMAILLLLCGPVGLIFQIIHWRQLVGYQVRLAGLDRGSRRRRDLDE